MDVLGVKSDITAADAAGQDLLARVAALESKSASDVNQIVAEIISEIQQLRAEIAGIVAFLKSLDGTMIKLTMGPGR